MSQIEKLQIEGIRSYGEPAVIEFFTPLTLIVGANGAGKTTIIEALNYVTTGDMPPNSKGAAFVYDPKVAGEQEVKGQVKLMMKDVSGHRVIVTRSLISTQKLKKLECKNLENVIKRNIDKEWVSVSSKCADINREMVTCLGVSKAVLDCVIFCHQEDSLWPLSEGKVLKTKFDEIFAATRYIKALESIRKFRKDQAAEVKQFKTELEYMKANKEKADEIVENLEKTSKKLEETQDQVEQLMNSLGPVETRLIELGKVHQNLNKLEKNLDLYKSEKRQQKSIDSDIRGKITNFFEGSASELQRFYNEFHTELKQKEEQLKQTEERLRCKNHEQSDLNSKRSSILVDHGKLQQEAERHKLNVEDRDTMIVEQSKMFQFSGFENPPFSQEKVTMFLESTKDNYQKLVQEGRDSKQACQARIDSIQSKIDGIRKTLYQYEETIRIKNNLLANNQKKLRQVGHDLGNVDASAKKLERVEKELRTAEKELEDTKQSGNVGQWKIELEDSQKEKRRLELDLSRLRDEQQAMHLQSTAQAKLDMSRKQKEEKEDAIQKIVQRNEEQLRTMLGVFGPVDTVKTQVSKFLQEKRTELRSINSDVQKMRQQQSSKQAEIRMTLDQIENLEKAMAGYKSQVKKACGEKDYDTLKGDIYDSIEQAKSKCSQLAAFETIYKKYISNMEEKGKKEPCCPLCHRQFSALKEMQNLVDELKDKIHKVPEKMRIQQESLQRDEAVHESLQKLASVKDNLEDIEKNKLPIAKARLSKLSEELAEMNGKIEELEDVRSVVECEESDARKLEPDLIMLEEHQKSLKNLDKEISLQRAKMGGVVLGRSMQIVTNEISDCQDRVDGLSRVIERKRNQISQLESQLASLTSNVHELSSEKLRLTGELQRRTHLENQKAELTAANMEYEREIKEAERQLQPIKTSLQELEQQHKSVIAEQDTHLEKTNTQLNEVKGYVNKLKDKIKEIRKYLTDNRESVLEKIIESLSTMDEKLNTVTKERKRLSSEIDDFKDELSSQQVRARELEDNLKLFEIEKKISQLDKDISRVEIEQEQLGNVNELRREQNTLQRKLETYHQQKATGEGRLTGYKEEMARFQKDLNSSLYKDADSKHRKKLIEIKTTELANDDLEKYYKALDRAIMKFHSLKMEEINKIVKEYWINTYRGRDIDTVEIRSDEDAEKSSISTRRSYNYKVVMIKGDVALDMRGRCSAGQKVLASLIIRLALAETFCLSCGILALDEPTANLDDENIESLANQLASIVRTRNPQKNFQLVVITHDEHFVELLGQADFVEYYYRVAKDDNGISRVYKQSTSGVETT